MTSIFVLLAILGAGSALDSAFADRDFKKVVQLYDPFEEDSVKLEKFLISALRLHNFNEIAQMYSLSDLRKLKDFELLAYFYSLFNVPGGATRSLYVMNYSRYRFRDIDDWITLLMLKKKLQLEDLEGASYFYAYLLRKYPGSRRTEEALIDLAGAYFQEGQPEATLALLDEYEKNWKIRNRERRALALLFRARALQKMKKKRQSRAVYKKLLKAFPDMPYALEAIPEVRGNYFYKARALYENGQYGKAWRYIRLLSPKNRRVAYLRLNLLHRLGRYRQFLRESNYLRKRLSPSLRRRIEFLRALTYEKLGKDRKALKVLLGLLKSKGEGDKAAFEISYILAKNREKKWLSNYTRKFVSGARKTGRTYPLLRAGLLELLRGDTASAESLFKEASADTGLVGAGARFWLYAITSSDSLLQQIAEMHPFSYYCWKSGGTPRFSERSLRELIGTDSQDELGDFRYFAYLGEVEEAKKALGGGLGAYLRAMEYSDRVALDYLKVHYAVKLLLGILEEGGEVPGELAEGLFPRLYRGTLSRIELETGVEAELLLSLIREESRFNPEAISPKGAIGLTQLMPFTAEKVLGRDVDGTELMEPELNIEIGAKYLSDLLREFGDPVLALAAYNAGPHRVRKWIRDLNLDSPELFVEFIPFRETRKYVKRVMRSYYLYRRLFGSDFSR